MIGFLAGVLVGEGIGFITACLCQAAKHGSESTDNLPLECAGCRFFESSGQDGISGQGCSETGACRRV